MVNIIGYENVTVGTEVVQQPIYDEPVIVIGSGDKQVVMSVAEYEADLAAKAAAAEAERIAQEEAAAAQRAAEIAAAEAAALMNGS